LDDESDDEDNNQEIIGKGWWKRFCQCHKNQLSAKKAVRFDSFRDDWCTVQNFETMYEKIYTCMADCGVAIKWADDPKWFSHDGVIVESEEEACGRKTEYELICPDKVLFVDEVGCNMSQKNDRNIGGEKFLVCPDSQAQIQLAFKDCHFTVLGFTAATGEPVLCVIVLASKTMKMDYIMGVNPFANIDEDNLLTDNHCDGEDKYFSMGPSCDVGGKKVPCFICNSENGSITSELLCSMLKHMDDCHIFDRTGGVLPFLLLDSHGSRFELPFLEYINDVAHK